MTKITQLKAYGSLHRVGDFMGFGWGKMKKDAPSQNLRSPMKSLQEILGPWLDFGHGAAYAGCKKGEI